MSAEARKTVDMKDEGMTAGDLRVERERELHFFDAHPDLERQLVGQWVALDGDQLISHGPDLGDVLQKARDAGHPHLFVTRVPDPAVTFVF
jgi:hypothetical protein